jgi:CRP-like cAMP-binding protein
MEFLGGALLSGLPTNLAAILLLLAALAGGSRTLHILGALAGLLLAASFAGLGNLTGAIWAAVFAAVNLARLARIIHRHRRNFMTAEQRDLIELVLAVHDPRQQRHLLAVISWRDAKLEEVLMWQGQRAPPLIFLAQGQAKIEHDGVELGTCNVGEFMGEMSLISGQRATATVTISQSARIAVFDRDALLRLLPEMPDLARSLDHTFNRSLAEKIQRMNKARTEG